MIVYQDLLDSGVPLSVFAKVCGLAGIYDWQYRGIPFKFQFKLQAIIDGAKRSAARKAAREAARAPQTDLFATHSIEKSVRLLSDLPLKNNNLDLNLRDSGAALVTLAKSQSTIPDEETDDEKAYWLAFQAKQSQDTVECLVYFVVCYIDSLLEVLKYKTVLEKDFETQQAKYHSKVYVDRMTPQKAKEQQQFLWHFDNYGALPTDLFTSVTPHFLFLAQLYSLSVFARLKAVAVVKEYADYRLKGHFKLLRPFVPQQVPEKDVASHIVKYRYALHDTARKLLPHTRLKACCEHAIGDTKHDRLTSGEYETQSSDIGIKYHPSTNTTSFFGLQTCGSVWQCPICAAKISAYRGTEMNQAMALHTADSKAFREKHGKDWHTLPSYMRDFGVTSFVTRTIPHQEHHSLDFILDSFKQADVKFKQHRRYKALMKKYGVIGSVKIYELTVGKNGWHLHVHETYFHKSEKDCLVYAPDNNWYSAFRSELYPLWADSADGAGFDKPSYEHGLQVQNGDFAADYVTKWGKEPSEGYWTVDKEMSRSHLKTSKKGLSPFDLLRQFHATGNSIYSDLFKDYARVMSGARQMVWSRGLKDHFGIEEKSDETIAAEDQDVSAFEMLTFTRGQWVIVRKHRLKAQVLLSALQGSEAVFDFLKNFG